MDISRVIFLLIAVILFCTQPICVTAAIYPMEGKIIDKNGARYDTPENAYIAILSSMIHGDVEWYYLGLTEESARDEIALYKKYNFSIQEKFDAVKNIKQIIFLDKKPHKDGVFLLIEIINEDGSVLRGPSIFAQEDGLWKSKSEISPEDPILDYLVYIPPLFDGKGQRPADVNSFLSYEQPTQVKTELATGTANYTIHVYYGKTVDPATFTAKLNKQDISPQFSPKPFTDQEVAIPLQKGRNVLVLSIDGTRKDGKKAKDSDRLVFSVP